MALLQEIQAPLLAVNDTTLTVAEVSLSPGSKIAKGDIVLVFETSKTTYEVAAETDGYIQYLCEAGRDYEVNTVVARIYSEAAEAAVTAAPPSTPATAYASAAAHAPSTAVHASASGPAAYAAAPAAMYDAAMPTQETPAYWDKETLFSREADRLIAETGLDRNMFKGRDFVTAADVHVLLKPAATGAPVAPPTANGLSNGTAATGPAPAKKPAVAVDPAKAILEKLSSAKKREIEYLADIQSSGLTSTIYSFVEMPGIFSQLNKSMRYLKDSLLPVIIYETSRMLAEYPHLNAYYTGDAVAIHREVNPGFAIDIDRGLKVLKIAGASAKGLREIEQDIMDLSGLYLDDKLALEHLTDITFTITDLSGEGVGFFYPLINKMNSSILGVSAVDEKLQRTTLSLTFDHRVTEGKLAARFLKELKERLESYRPAGPIRQDITCFKCLKTLQEDLGGTGFVRVVDPRGEDAYICQTCLKGF